MPRGVNLEAVGIKRNEENEFKENRFFGRCAVLCDFLRG